MTEHFANMIAEIAARVDGEAPPPRFTKEAVEGYRWLGDFGASVLAELGLDPRAIEDDANDDWPLACALFDIGARFARIVAEPAFKLAPDKAARDFDYGRPTMHLARQFRWPQTEGGRFPAEKGAPAIILPVKHDRTVHRAVNGDVRCDASALLSLAAGGGETDIADLVAMPLDGGRVLSLTGYTVGIGSFGDVIDNAITLYASGRAWLDAWLDGIRAQCADFPPRLAAEQFFPFAPPAGVLLVEARGFEWRLCRSDCVIPHRAQTIRCPDSSRLAAFIATAMRAPDVVREAPEILGPQTQTARAA